MKKVVWLMCMVLMIGIVYAQEETPPLGDLELTCEDIEKDLEEAKSFIKTMFPEEKLNG